MVTIGCELVLLSDQLLSDNSIPLSPQWLYSKPVDAKTTANPVGVCNIWCFDCYLHYQSPSPLHEIYWCDRVLLLFFIILLTENLSFWKLESLKWHDCMQFYLILQCWHCSFWKQWEGSLFDHRLLCNYQCFFSCNLPGTIVIKLKSSDNTSACYTLWVSWFFNFEDSLPNSQNVFLDTAVSQNHGVVG